MSKNINLLSPLAQLEAGLASTSLRSIGVGLSCVELLLSDCWRGCSGTWAVLVGEALTLDALPVVVVVVVVVWLLLVLLFELDGEDATEIVLHFGCPLFEFGDNSSPNSSDDELEAELANESEEIPDEEPELKVGES